MHDSASLELLATYSAVSSSSVKDDLTSLPQLHDVDDAEELVDLDMLPSLPRSTQEEDDELMKISEQPMSIGDDWDLTFPPFPLYDEYWGKFWYCTPNRDGKLITRIHPGATRERVRWSLEHCYCLRKHLTANLALLQQYGEDGLAATVPPTDRKAAGLSSLEIAQSAFAVHHIGISETLISIWSYSSLPVGLPGYTNFRDSRNFFAHDFGTPEVMLHPLRNLKTEVKGKQALYESLLVQVATNITMLEDQLADEEIWSKPEPTKPTPRSPGPTEAVSDSCDWISDGAGHMAYERQTQNDQQEEEDEAQEANADDHQHPGCCATSFKYLFLRSSCVRNITTRLGAYVADLEFEFSLANLDFTGETDFVPDEGNSNDGMWSLPTDEPNTYAESGFY